MYSFLITFVIFTFVTSVISANVGTEANVISFNSLYGSEPTRYYADLYFNLQNLRFAENTTAKPFFITFPSETEHFRRILNFCRQTHVQPLVRSGGHSYEGLSSTSEVPFLIVDLRNWTQITVDVLERTARVRSGATLGDVYYNINNATNGTFGFSAGSCPTVGTGGHISGGGFGLLSRKYGLAADNVVDVLFMAYNGTVFDKANMTEDLYFSLRGGGGGSFGIVLEWKIKILRVPSVLTVFNKVIDGRKMAQDLVGQWQTIAPFARDNLYLSVFISGVNSTLTNPRHPLLRLAPATDVEATFHGQALLPAKSTERELLRIFPELNITRADLTEMTWIESVLFFSGLPAGSPPEALLDRFNPNKEHFKAKSDYVQAPIDSTGLDVAFDFLDRNSNGYILLDPYGGFMSTVSSTALPFPHRAGNLYSIQYQAVWNDTQRDAENIAWLQDFYAAMTPYVSHDPRSTYVNYLDLDLGTAPNGTSSISDGLVWGQDYFSAVNYARLARTKAQVDPINLFRNAQSVQGNIV